jgi:hypothetical protein
MRVNSIERLIKKIYSLTYHLENETEIVGKNFFLFDFEIIGA